MRDDGILGERLRKLRRRKERSALARSLAVTGLTVYLLFGVVFGIAVVEGDSMNPALKEGDVVLFLRLSSEYDRGDIVLIHTEGRGYYVKRVCALPGETVDIDERCGRLLINGKEIIEPYIYEETHGKTDITYPLTMTGEEYFCMGDNRENSLDSRNYGAISEDKIDGKVLVVLRFF